MRGSELCMCIRKSQRQHEKNKSWLRNIFIWSKGIASVDADPEWHVYSGLELNSITGMWVWNYSGPGASIQCAPESCSFLRLAWWYVKSQNKVSRKMSIPRNYLCNRYFFNVINDASEIFSGIIETWSSKMHGRLIKLCAFEGRNICEETLQTGL